MVIQDSRQRPVFDVRDFVSHPYRPGSLFDVLERFVELIVSPDDFPPSMGGGPGAPSWCPVLLTKLVLLQERFNWSDREAVRRARSDLEVKACLGLGVDQPGPSQPTLVRHRARMQQLELTETCQKRFVELLAQLELLTRDEGVLVDSAPIAGAGQVQDTYNLLGGAIRRGLRQLAKLSGMSIEECAAEHRLSEYVRRSIKGEFVVDWSKEAERHGFLAQLVRDAARLQEIINATLLTSDSEAKATSEAEDVVETQLGLAFGEAEKSEPSSDDVSPSDAKLASDKLQAQLTETSALLNDIVSHDVAFNAEAGTLYLPHRPGNDRIISSTDPEMRHGRKSASQVIAGYKVQLVVSAVLGFILLLKIIRANRHDGEDLPELMEGLEARRGLQPSYWTGDHAYGTLRNHCYVHSQNAEKGTDLELVAKIIRPSQDQRLTKDDFKIDFDSRTLQCPAGRTSNMRHATRHGERGWLFEFPPDTCACCPLREACMSPKAGAKTGRKIFIVEEKERILREHLVRRNDSDFVELYRERSLVERVIAGFSQHGAKQARRFGEDNIQFDKQTAALAYNLDRLGALARQKPDLMARLEALRQAACLFLCLCFAYHNTVRQLVHACLASQGQTPGEKTAKAGGHKRGSKRQSRRRSPRRATRIKTEASVNCDCESSS